MLSQGSQAWNFQIRQHRQILHSTSWKRKYFAFEEKKTKEGDDDEQSGGRGAEGGGEEEIGSTVKIVPQARGSREELMDTEYQGIFSKTQNWQYSAFHNNTGGAEQQGGGIYFLIRIISFMHSLDFVLIFVGYANSYLHLDKFANQDRDTSPP